MAHSGEGGGHFEHQSPPQATANGVTMIRRAPHAPNIPASQCVACGHGSARPPLVNALQADMCPRAMASRFAEADRHLSNREVRGVQVHAEPP